LRPSRSLVSIWSVAGKPWWQGADVGPLHRAGGDEAAMVRCPVQSGGVEIVGTKTATVARYCLDHCVYSFVCLFNLVLFCFGLCYCPSIAGASHPSRHLPRGLGARGGSLPPGPDPRGLRRQPARSGLRRRRGRGGALQVESS
jgi:hypothetical protein